jgi:hypothetical protein
MVRRQHSLFNWFQLQTATRNFSNPWISLTSCHQYQLVSMSVNLSEQTFSCRVEGGQVCICSCWSRWCRGGNLATGKEYNNQGHPGTNRQKSLTPMAYWPICCSTPVLKGEYCHQIIEAFFLKRERGPFCSCLVSLTVTLTFFYPRRGFL